MPSEKSMRDYALDIAEGIGGFLSPDEAEAGGMGAIVKLGTGGLGKRLVLGTAKSQAAEKAIARGVLSETSSKLAGTPFREGIIKKVSVGKGNLRYIVLEDNTAYPATADYVRQQVEHVRGAEVIKRKAAAGEAVLYEAAKKAYNRNIAKMRSGKGLNPFLRHKAIKQKQDTYVSQIEQSGVEGAEEYVLIKGSGYEFSFPSRYATILKNRGHNIEILKGK